MPLLQLLAATAALLAGSASCAAWIERRSLSRRLLLLSVIFPAQVTAVVLVTGWLLGTFRPVPLLITAVAVGVAEAAYLRGRVTWRGEVSPRRAIGRCWSGLRRHPLAGLVVLVSAVPTAWQALRAIRLPVTSYDSLAYHLTEPTSWVLAGRVGRSGLTVSGSGYPQGQEVLHGWSMVFLHSIRGTGLVPLFFSIIAGLAIFRIARHLGASSATAVVGAAVFTAMPAAALQISTAYVDLAAAGAGLAAVALALEARNDERPFGLLFGACLATGLAIAMKPSLAPVGLAVVVLAAIISRKAIAQGRPVRGIVGRWAVGALAITGLGGVWYVHNWVTQGNPFYPVSVFGFEGRGSFAQMVSSTQAPIEIRHRSVPYQIFQSWTEDLHHHSFMYDQRLGGLGAVWLLLCLPAIVIAGRRLWARDRTATLVLGGTGLATAWASGSMWWGRYALVLAAVGCVALALAATELSSARWRTALLGATVLLVGFTTFSALAPSHERTLAADGTTLVVGLPELASTVVAGDGDEHLMPWIGARGMRKIPSGTTIAYVEALPPQYPQVLAGIDLDHPLVHLRRPATPKALAGALKASGADYLYLPEPLAPGGVEAVAVSDRLHWRRVDTGGPVHGGALWEVGTFDECLGGEITATVVGRSITGTAADRCGPLAEADLELWLAGPDEANAWEGAARISTALRTDERGRYLFGIERKHTGRGQRYFVRFTGRDDTDHYRPTAASLVVSPTR